MAVDVMDVRGGLDGLFHSWVVWDVEWELATY